MITNTKIVKIHLPQNKAIDLFCNLGNTLFDKTFPVADGGDNNISMDIATNRLQCNNAVHCARVSATLVVCIKSEISVIAQQLTQFWSVHSLQLNSCWGCSA